MKSLLILGCGGHGRVVADVATACGYDEIAFLDDAPAAPHQVGCKVLGPITMLSEMKPTWPTAFAAIGNGQVRLMLFKELVRLGFTTPNIIHPLSIVSRGAQLAAGIFIAPGAVINTGVRIEDAAIINTGATVDHDCRIGSGSHIAPGATLSGDVAVGSLAWLGTGCSVRQSIVIGKEAVVGVGAAVVSDVLEGQTYAGVPARPLRNIQEGGNRA